MLQRPLHFTKSLKRDNTYKLCLWITEEHSCLIITNYTSQCQSLDIAHAQKYTLLLQNHSGVTMFKYSINEC